MALTIEQALQQGVAAHKAGRHEEAERLYRAILQSQPLHPDANHNLGLIAVSINKAEAALPLFKTALEANPKIEQFWLSYIDALIKEKQFENAKLVIEQAKTQGVAEEKLNVLETQLTLTAQVKESKLVVQKKSLTLSEKRKKLAEQKNQKKAKKQNLKAISPSESEMTSLLEHYQNGQYDDAEKLAKSITQEFPKNQFGWKVLGVILQQTGRIRESLVPNKKAAALFPQDPEAHSNLGITLKELGRLDEAVVSYTQAIALKPDYAEAHYNLGNTLQELGRLDEAEASYKQAIALKPDFALAHTNLGVTLKELGRLEEAEASYTNAKALKPDHAGAHSNLGITLKELGRLDEAEASFRHAIALKSDFAEAHSNLGGTLQELDRLDEAEASCRQAIALKPDFAEAHNNLGVTLQELGRLDEAEANLRQAIALKPGYAEAHNNLGNTLKGLGRLDEALASYNTAIELKVDFPVAYSNKNLCLNYSSLWSSLLIYKTHLEFEKQFGGLKIEPPLSIPLKTYLGERLRIGYVSADFRKHSVAYFFEPLIQHHSGHIVETFCYHNNALIDATTKRLMIACDHWRSIYGIADPEVANLIRNDKIDILVDLSGHTLGNRLLVFAQKPAPIQITWLGYPNTTGLSAIDYRFTDIIADPIGGADKLHSETLLRLPNGFQCYQGNEKVHFRRELPEKSEGRITFGSFNNLSKITPQVIKAWSTILHEVPTSQLILKGFQLNHTKNHYLELFKKEGLAEDRIKLYGQLTSVDGHLDLYNAIDIGLDPFPFNGATTTCEALWMGVPVITLLGDRHVGRVGASILTNVGLTDFIAQDIDGYIRLAVEMAANTNYLKEVRVGLRERMQKAPLCDGRSFASDVETAYQDVWRKYLN
jgi:protein O-GlcNAc transferase